MADESIRGLFSQKNLKIKKTDITEPSEGVPPVPQKPPVVPTPSSSPESTTPPLIVKKTPLGTAESASPPSPPQTQSPPLENLIPLSEVAPSEKRDHLHSLFSLPVDSHKDMSKPLPQFETPPPKKSSFNLGYCANHPETPAVAICTSCTLSYCGSCITRVGDTYICNSCLQHRLQKTQRAVYRGSLTFKLLTASFLALLLSVLSLISNGQQTIDMTIAILTGSVVTYYAQDPHRFMIIVIDILRALLFFLVSYLTIQMSPSTFPIAILSSMGVFGWYFYRVISAGQAAFPNELLFLKATIEAGAAFLIFILILLSRGDLRDNA